MRVSFWRCATALGFLLAAPAALAQQAGGTFVYVVQPEPPTLASFLSTSGPIGQVAAKIYDGLLEYDAELNPIPGLAESYSVSEDGLNVSFTLRQGVTWHDGEPFTSADVQFSVMEVLKKYHPRGPLTFKEVEAVETPDDHSVVLKLAHPAPYMLRALSGYESPMLPKHLMEGTDIAASDLANNPVGTGAYKFVEWQKGQYIRLEKNEDYWKEGLPYLDRVVARFISDASTRTAAIENGEVHYAGFGAIPNIDVVRLRDVEGIEVTTDGYSMINPMALLELDTTKPPFDNVDARRAVSFAIDRRFIIDNIWFGYGKPATSALSSNFEATGLYKAEEAAYPPEADPEAAKALLDKAGLTPDANGVRARITQDLIPYGEEWRRLGEYIKQALGDVGIEAELRYEDVPTWLNRVYTNYDFTMNSNFFYQLPDPAIGVERQYLSDQIRQGTVFTNSSRYSNPEVDRLLSEAGTEPDAEKRAELYHQAQDILAEDLPVVNLFEMEFTTVYLDKVKDVTTSPLGPYGPMERVWIEE